MRVSISQKWYLIGFAVLLLVLFLYILRFNGYMWSWDLSGAFDMRSPFSQYFYTYTQYDGVEVGIKNRLPIALLLFLIYSVSDFTSLHPEIAVKIATVFVYLSAYTSIFLLLPKFNRMLRKSEVELSPMLLTVLSLLYCFIPTFTYRTPQLHLFFFSALYPLGVYAFLKLITEKENTTYYVLIFVIIHFIGLTSPHIIFYFFLTYIVFFVCIAVTKSSEVPASVILARLIITGILVVLVNLYWIIPYVIEQSPNPGYMVSQQVVELLGNQSTFQNFLLDSSEWFLPMIPNTDTDANTTLIIQIIGALSIYIFAITSLFTIKNKGVLMGIILLLLITLLLAVKGTPVFAVVYSTLIYSKFGWIFREVSRIRLIWAFWTYILFAIGLNLFFEDFRKGKRILDNITVLLVTATSLFVVFMNSITSFLTIAPTLKATPISANYKELTTLLAMDNGYGFVDLSPRYEAYKANWQQSSFSLADEVNYLFTGYNLPQPPLYRSSVLSANRKAEDFVSEYLYLSQSRPEKTANIAAAFDIRYVLIQKKAIPLSEGAQSFLENTTLLVNRLNADTDYKKVLDNDDFTLYKNEKHKSGIVKPYAKEFGVNGDFKVLEKLTNIEGYKFAIMEHPATESNTKNVLVSESVDYPYLSLATYAKRANFTDSTKIIGINVIWGRASLSDRLNGEIHNVFRHWGIRNLQLSRYDSVVFSDITIKEPNTKAEIKAQLPHSCTKCLVFAKVLFTPLGGDLNFNYAGQTKTISLKDQADEFKWVLIFSGAKPGLNNTISMTAVKGFVAVSDVIAISDEENAMLEKQWNEYSVTTVSTSNLSLDGVNPQCSFANNNLQRGLINMITVAGNCKGEVFGYIPTYQNDLLVHNKVSNSWYFSREIDLIDNFDYEIFLVNRTTIVMWSVFIPTVIIIVYFVGKAFILRKKYNSLYTYTTPPNIITVY